METYPNEAPKTVEHILALVKRNFYNGLRVHRVVPGFVVQFGDPQTRDMTKKADWGTRGSGKPIGVAEVSPKRPHRSGRCRRGAWPATRGADSQMYIALAAAAAARTRLHRLRPGDLRHGCRARSFAVPDVIKRVTVKEAAK